MNNYTIKLEKKLFIQNLFVHQQELTTIISNNESHDKKCLKIIDAIKNNRKLLDQISNDGTTILMLAAAFNQIRIMEFLLEYDNSYSLQPKLLKKTRTDGINALMIAVMFEHVESIDFLLSKASSLLKMKQKNDTSIIKIAAGTNNPKIMLEVLYKHLFTHYRQKGYTSLFKEYKNYTMAFNGLSKSNHQYDWITNKNMMLFIMKLRNTKVKKAVGRIKQLTLQKDKNNSYNVKVIRKRIKLNYKTKLPDSIKRMPKRFLEKRKKQIIYYLKNRYCKINSVFRKDFLRFNDSLKLKYPKGSKQIRLMNPLFAYQKKFNRSHRQTFHPNKTIKSPFIKTTNKLSGSLYAYKMFASKDQRYPNDVFVKGLPMNINESQLRIKFSSYGIILRVKIPEPKKDFCSRIAFITFKNRKDALQKFNNNTKRCDCDESSVKKPVSAKVMLAQKHNKSLLYSFNQSNQGQTLSSSSRSIVNEFKASDNLTKDVLLLDCFARKYHNTEPVHPLSGGTVQSVYILPMFIRSNDTPIRQEDNEYSSAAFRVQLSAAFRGARYTI